MGAAVNTLIVHRWSLAPVLGASLALAACGTGGDGEEPELTFSALSDAQLREVIHAAAGDDIDTFRATARDFVGQNYDGCPRVTTVGAHTTVTGGCTWDGEPVEGSLVIDNLAPPDGATTGAFDPSGVQTIEADGFGLGLWRNDGSLRDAPSVRGHLVSASIALSSDGFVTHTDGSYDCDSRDCVVGLGSTVTLVGIGSARVSGQFSAAAHTGELLLDGADGMVVDLAHSTALCFRVTLDGKAPRDVCLR